jgi:RNA polymerase sigma factor (sigma-70 family)
MKDKKKLLEDHITFAEVIAIEYFNIPMADYKEAFSEAYLALNRAVEKYDQDKGEFIPFAARSIRNALNTLYAKQLRMAKMFPKSLDSPPSWKSSSGSGSSSSKSLVRTIVDSRQNVRRQVGLQEADSVLNEVMDALSPRERSVLEKIRLGFSLSEIGERMGISKQAVHKISAPALVKLRSHLEKLGFRGIDSYGLLKTSSSGRKITAG